MTAKSKAEKFNVIVVGAGHAGCEAALASARLGKKTLLLTMNLDQIAHMPCNPSIGGTGKGQLVKEIDALGGEMGVLIDKCFIQSRMLNRSKGPAVWSPRAQADKERYHEEMKKTLEGQEGLHLRQGEVERLLYEEENEKTRTTGVLLSSGEKYRADAVILATGTYLGSLVFVSDRSKESGPSGFDAATALAKTMKEDGFKLRRFKTGTPARVLKGSLDYEKMTEQKGDEDPIPFSYLNDEVSSSNVSCWLTYTNPEAHKLVAENIGLTAPYGGHTTGVGTRYCLSIEDKVSRFPDRKRHQLFLEPEGIETEEVYIQGMSTSLPESLQEQFYRMIPGLEQAVFSRYAYSIEYECLDPLTLTPSLAYKGTEGLFCAGQINGTSGYEEAAAQGLMAGINASRAIDGEEPFVLERAEAYIGVLIDDLVTKGTEEPYRIMTSRAEFRLVLRQDNADLRLTPKGYEIGLATKERYERYIEKKRVAEAEIKRLKETKVTAEQANELLSAAGSAPVTGSVSLAELLARPEVSYEMLEMSTADTIQKTAGTGIPLGLSQRGDKPMRNSRLPADEPAPEASGTDTSRDLVGGEAKSSAGSMRLPAEEPTEATAESKGKKFLGAWHALLIAPAKWEAASTIREMELSHGKQETAGTEQEAAGTGTVASGTDTSRRVVDGEKDNRAGSMRLPDVIIRAGREQAAIEIKYAGYIEKQRQEIEKFRRLENKRMPEGIDYGELEGLRLEARQKLSQVRPASLGQAARISGVSPADISVLMVHMARREEGESKHRK